MFLNILLRPHRFFRQQRRAQQVTEPPLDCSTDLASSNKKTVATKFHIRLKASGSLITCSAHMLLNDKGLGPLSVPNLREPVSVCSWL